MMLKRLRRTFGVEEGNTRPKATGYHPVDTTDGTAETDELNPRPEPRDSGRVYWAFWALGAGVLLAWNVLICSFPLLASFFTENSGHRANLASYLSTVYCFANLFFLGLAQRSVSTTSPINRIRWSLTLFILTSLIFSFPILPLLLPYLSSSPTLLLIILLLTSGVLAISTAYLQSGVFALSAIWPTTSSNATLAVMSGQGGIAVLVSGIQLILAALGSLNESGKGGEQGKPSILIGVLLWVLAGVGGIGCRVALKYIAGREEYRSIGQRRDDGVLVEKGMTKVILRKNVRLELAVAWVFTVTLSVFPPLTTAIVSTHYPPPRLLQPGVFIPLHFLIFNSRTYIPRIYLPTSQNTVLSLSLSRTLLIPLFLLCNINTSTKSQGVAWINSDIMYFLILLIFGMTNGWVSSLCMILASNPVLNPRIMESEKDVAGTLAAFCLVSGLAAGSVASFGVNWIVRGSFA